MAKLAVLGAGSWGTTVASMVAAKVPTTLWAREPEIAAAIDTTHRNPIFVTDQELHADLRSSSVLADVLAGAEGVIVAVPSQFVRSVLRQAAPHVPAGVPILSLTKGLERDTYQRVTQVIAAELSGDHPIGVLTGPNLAAEIAAGQPAASVVAFENEELASRLQELLSGPTLRVYTNTDVVGCELGGVLKNVMAVAAGICDGLGMGDNGKAALITRGLAEMTRLGVALGGHPMTFLGLAGVGDLIATCTSVKSRNHRVGVEIGRGRALAEVVADTKMVAEGVETCLSVVKLAREVGVDVPIAEQVVEVLYHGRSPLIAVSSLMERQLKPELYGLPATEG